MVPWGTTFSDIWTCWNGCLHYQNLQAVVARVVRSALGDKTMLPGACKLQAVRMFMAIGGVKWWMSYESYKFDLSKPGIHCAKFLVNCSAAQTSLGCLNQIDTIWLTGRILAWQCFGDGLYDHCWKLLTGCWTYLFSPCFKWHEQMRMSSPCFILSMGLPSRIFCGLAIWRRWTAPAKRWRLPRNAACVGARIWMTLKMKTNILLQGMQDLDEFSCLRCSKLKHDGCP